MKNFSVTNAVDNYVAALEEERQPDGYWHPSSLFGCLRKSVYSYLGVPKTNPHDARGARVFRMGHILHEFVQGAIRADENIAAFYDEVKILDENLKIKGHADGLVLLDDGSWVVLELKSINSNAFRYAGELPKEDHIGQASTYVKVLRQYGGTAKLADGTEVTIPPIPELSRIVFAYISKDDLKIGEYTIIVTDEDLAEIDRRIVILDTHVANETLPIRLVATAKGKARHYLCGYCDYADRCWNQDKEGVLS